MKRESNTPPAVAVCELGEFASANVPDSRNYLLPLAGATTVLTWSAAGLAVYEAAQHLHPITLAFGRLVIGSIVLLIFALLFCRDQIKPPARKDLRGFLFMGIAGFPVYHIALNYGQRTVTAGPASVLMAVLPIFAALIAWATLRERITSQGWLGIAIAFAGVTALVIRPGLVYSLDGNALFVLVSAFAGAVFMVMQRGFSARYNGLQMALWPMLIGTALLLPETIFATEEILDASRDVLWLLLFLGVFPTALAYVCWAYVLTHLDAARATSLMYLTPPIAYLLAWMIQDLTPTLVGLVSSIVIIVGVVLVQRAPQQLEQKRLNI